jgi:hypothetical protein
MGQATDALLVTQGYKYTLRICNTYCFSTAIMVARTRLHVTLILLGLPRFNVPKGDLTTKNYVQNPFMQYKSIEIFISFYPQAD